MKDLNKAVTSLVINQVVKYTLNVIFKQNMKELNKAANKIVLNEVLKII